MCHIYLSPTQGRVAAHKGHYADGLAKGKTVVLLLTETTGAVEGTAVGALRAWHNESRTPGHADRTAYGWGRGATKSFFAHHLRLISLAAVVGAMQPVEKWVMAAKSQMIRNPILADFMPAGL